MSFGPPPSAFRFSVDDMSPGEEYEMPGTWATYKALAKGSTERSWDTRSART